MGRATALIVMGFFISFGVVRINLNEQALSAIELYDREYDRVTRLNAKNSAVNIALLELRDNFDWRADSLSSDPELAYEQLFSWRDSTGTGTISGLRMEVVEDSTSTSKTSTPVRIRAISESNDVEDTTVVVIDRASFSRYAYFTNYEGNLWFSSADTIRGPMHTNEIFYMKESPTFYGLMSSVADTYIAQDAATKPNFLGGTSFGRSIITMPDAAELEYLKDEAEAQGHLYSGDLWLTFYADGTYDWVCERPETTTTTLTHTHIDSGGGVGHTHPDNAGWHEGHAHYASSSIQRWDGWTNVYIYSYDPHRHFGATLGSHSHTTVSITTVTESGTRTLNDETIIATSSSTQDIHVHGTVNGMVTVYSAGHIWIDDDIRYADDPRDGESDDVLGLLAYKSVVVTDNNANNDGHVWIEATIGSMTTELPPGAYGSYAAYEKCFHAENFDTRPQGTLHVYGGIVQRERGAVAYGSYNGLAKDYQYDKRFLILRPPSYPVLGENVILAWRE